MKNTRADGLTVGAAMDKDAAFLRSVGIDAPDSVPTIYELEDDFIHLVRGAVLDALDAAAKKGGGENGWEDGDLPQLFKAVDAQSKIVFDRIHGFVAVRKEIV